METVRAYWFAASDTLSHGDGRKVVLGETHSLTGGKIIACARGFHGSEHPFDALQYAPGPYLYQVEQWGSIVRENDKLASRHRKYLAMIDATPLLLQFSREQALSVIHLWNAPDVVKRYLETGDESLRLAARGAAAEAAWSTSAGEAARAAAWAAAEWSAAAWSAARVALAREAAWEAAWTVATAARSAARSRFAELVEEAFVAP